MLDENGEEVDIKENINATDSDSTVTELANDKEAYGYEEDFGAFGYQKQELVDGEFADVDDSADDSFDDSDELYDEE